MSYFAEVDGLEDLEKQEKWEEARLLLDDEWKDDKLNSDKLLRLLSECWYVLSLWDCCINTEKLSYQAFQDTLIECMSFGLSNFGNAPRFLCVAGYMASILPYLFYKSGSGDLFAEWEQKGIEMLRKSTLLDPNDLLAKTLNLGTSAHSSEYASEYAEAKKRLSSQLSSLFPSETAIELYYKDILGHIY